MAKTMTKHGVTVTQRDDGRWEVCGNETKTFDKWLDACRFAFDEADTIPEGAEVNIAMCEFFGRATWEYSGEHYEGEIVTHKGHTCKVLETWVDDGRNGITIEPVEGYGFPIDIYDDQL